MTKEMYAAQVKNWLMDLATGAKAAKKAVQFASDDENMSWRVTATCYDKYEEGVAVHKLKALAEAIEVPVMFEAFKPEHYCYGKYAGFNYIELFGVRFYDYADYEEDD